MGWAGWGGKVEEEARIKMAEEETSVFQPPDKREHNLMQAILERAVMP